MEAIKNAGEFGSTSWRTSIKVAGKKKLIEEKWKFSSRQINVFVPKAPASKATSRHSNMKVSASAKQIRLLKQMTGLDGAEEIDLPGDIFQSTPSEQE